MSNELLNIGPEFDKKRVRETERTYLPVFPERLRRFMEESDTVQQFYLSHPSEPFSLRFRETTKADGSRQYTATVKDRGTITDAGLDRLEVEIAIAHELYEFYKTPAAPLLHKFRATPAPSVSIDFYANDHVQCEAEEPAAWEHFIRSQDNAFVDITGDIMADNEWRAHYTYRQAHDGEEAFTPSSPLDADFMARTVSAQLSAVRPLVVSVAGRSGSGKTTLLQDVVATLQEQGIDSLVLSTDDYHRGKQWLERHKGSEWTEWDAPIVYDVQKLVHDVTQLTHGTHVQKRWFDFETEEPAYGQSVAPQQVIFIEGIYAGSAMIRAIDDLRFEIPTPLATCVGRRLLRDLKDRPQFADPEKSLRYILEQAEPAYRTQASSDGEQRTKLITPPSPSQRVS